MSAAAKNREILLPVQRPDSTLIWLPESLLKLLGAARGCRLTRDQFNHQEVQAIIAARSQGGRRA